MGSGQAVTEYAIKSRTRTRRPISDPKVNPSAGRKIPGPTKARGSKFISGKIAAFMVLGRSAGLLVAGPRSQDLLAAIRRIQDGEWVPPYEDAFRCKDGNVLLVSVAVSPVMDEPRQLLGISQIVRPVTAGSAQAALRCAKIESQEPGRDLLHLSSDPSASHPGTGPADNHPKRP